MVDVCVNEVAPIVFCDKEGFDLVPFQMVLVIQDFSTHIDMKEDETNTSRKAIEAMYVKDEISICDKSQIEEVVDSSSEVEDPSRELFYDASNKLEEY